MSIFRLPLLLMLVLLFGAAAAANGRFFLGDRQRIVFLGDSITNAGTYVQYVEAYLLTRFPERKFELINLGLSSETVSGLSEAAHPWPRPDLHERLERVLAKTKPDVVVACYGMNDGIYHPPAAERLAKFQGGIRRLVERARKDGTKVVLITPPPFDPLPLKAKVQPKTARDFSWMKPYARYDDVLQRHSEWLLKLREQGVVVADAHGELKRFLAVMRYGEPGYHVAADGIHPNPTGHWPIAQQLLLAWEAPAEVDRAEIDAGLRRVRRGRVSGLAFAGDDIRFNWSTRLPMPYDSRWERRLLEIERTTDRLNRHRLLVTGLDRARYLLYEGDRLLGEVTREQLAAGIELTEFPELTSNRRAAELLKLVQQRERLLSPAWLTEVGHKRPDTPKGLPLAEARRRAAPLDARIRELLQPVTLALRLRPQGQ